MRKVFFQTRNFLMMVSFAATAHVHGQDSISTVMNEFRLLQKAYLQSPSLSFNVKYRYANENTPSVILDSVNGKMEIQNGSYHYALDSTETIKNNTYTIILFKEDKLMYLSKAYEPQQGQDPLALLDSALIKTPGIKSSVQQNATNKTISFIFPPDMPYKKIDFVINKTNGFMTKAMYLVKTEQLMEAGSSASVDNSVYDKYARVEVSFDHYTTAPIDTAMFDEKKYFLREGNEFKTTEQFKQYKIFIGSLNL